MDPFHDRLARVALRAAGAYGFCLAGGYAVQAHGYLERRSEDVDLFTTMAAEREFPDAVRAVIDALRSDGLEVELQTEGATFARLRAIDPVSSAEARVELGVDWRAHPPTQMEIGPVLHAEDAVANKVCALYGRGAVRDYIDVDGILRSGRHTLAEVLRLAGDHDPGFDPAFFAEALVAVRRFADTAFEPYGLSTREVTELQERIIAWAEQARTGRW